MCKACTYSRERDGSKVKCLQQTETLIYRMLQNVMIHILWVRQLLVIKRLLFVMRNSQTVEDELLMFHRTGG